MFFSRNSVRSAVVKVIDARIKMAEKSYQQALSNLIRETAETIKAVKYEQKIKQMNLLDECVQSVISPKVI